MTIFFGNETNHPDGLACCKKDSPASQTYFARDYTDGCLQKGQIIIISFANEDNSDSPNFYHIICENPKGPRSY